MKIAVQSYPELYTTLIGWQQYGLLWDVLTTTGLAYLPFIGLFLRHMAEPYKSQQTKDAFVVSSRRVMVDFLVMLVVVLFVVQPFVPLNQDVVKYRTVCEETVRDVYPGDTGTTYDEAFPIPSDVAVPIWWSFVIAVSQGVTAAAKAGIGCPENLRERITVVDATIITDPQLRQEFNQFYNQCFLPSRNKLFKARQHLDNHEYETRFAYYIEEYGDSDLNWYGSHAFTELDGFYDSNFAKQPIHGFAFDRDRDWQLGQLDDHEPAWGQPSCKDWWLTSDIGLRDRTLAVLPKKWHERYWSTLNPKDEDDILKKLIKDIPKGYQKANQSMSGSLEWLPQSTAWLGLTLNRAGMAPKLYTTLQAAPLVRALLLMLLYTFLPLALLLGAYRIHIVITATFFIFGVIFWDYIWLLIEWVDDVLINSFFPNVFVRNTVSSQAIIANWMITGLVIIAPLFWFSFMGAVGIAAGNLSSSIIDGMSNDAKGAAAQGGYIVQGAARDASVAGAKGVKKWLS